MKFKVFSDWCNERVCDGCWSMGTALYCVEILKAVNREHFWKKKKKWNELNKALKIEEMVNKLNALMEAQRK